jgi:hypothetical protein
MTVPIVQFRPPSSSIPSDHATAAPRLVAAIHRRRSGNTPQRYKQSDCAAPNTAPSTDPANTMAISVGNGAHAAAVTAAPTTAGTMKPIASPRVTTNTQRSNLVGGEALPAVCRE